MAFRVTASEVRNRLKNLTSADISDTKLEDLAFIEMSEAVIDQIMSENGVTYSSLTSTKQTLIKGAQIEHCCMTIINDAPEDFFRTGVIDGDPARKGEKDSAFNMLKKGMKDKLALAGCTFIQPWVSATVGDDYKPDGEESTNLIVNDTEEDIVSVM
jgi:hypothetical protein